jgi:regulator of sigma E protease
MLLTVIGFILILSVLVLIHELGHFTSAKIFGIKVEEFGFGLPPRIWGKKRGETIYSLNWLPIGGFVKLLGEEQEEEEKLSKSHKKELLERAFFHKPLWQRAIVLSAGVMMNFLLAVGIISYLFTQGVMVPTKNVRIEKVLPYTPAQTAGLQEGDIVRFILFTDENNVKNQVEISKSETLISTTRGHLGETIEIVVERDGSELTFSVIPRKEFPENEGPMGVSISNYEMKKYTPLQAPFYGMKEALLLSWELTKGIAGTIWKMISFQPVGQEVAGPLGIAQLTGQAVKFGPRAILELLGLLSLNLAIVNILPFPALDGGRLMFVVIEAATGRKLQARWERAVHQIGMLILLSLLALVTINDIVRIVTKAKFPPF